MIVKGGALRVLRVQRGIKQEELSERVGVSQSMISQIEHRTRECTFGLAAKIATALGCSVDEIFNEPSLHDQFKGNCRGLSKKQLSILNDIALEFRKNNIA